MEKSKKKPPLWMVYVVMLSIILLSMGIGFAMGMFNPLMDSDKALVDCWVEGRLCKISLDYCSGLVKENKSYLDDWITEQYEGKFELCNDMLED